MTCYKDLLELVYKYNPKSVHFTDERYQNTREFNSRKNMASSVSALELAKWEELKQCLKQRNFYVEDWTQFFNYDLCFRYRIISDENSNIRDIVINISIVCPLFSIYFCSEDSGNSDFLAKNEVEKNTLEVISLIIDTKYQYNSLDPNIATKVVPDVSIGNCFMGEATIFECLFTDHTF